MAIIDIQRPRRNTPTTGRHLNEWGFNTAGIEKLDEAEFERRMSLAIYKAMANKFAEKIGA